MGKILQKKNSKVVSSPYCSRLFQQRLSKFRDMLWHRLPELPDS